MNIGGFQKLTLTDFPGCVAATVFTRGCNLRCRYCHNPELLNAGRRGDFSEEAILDYLEARKKILDGVVITGGEPTLQKRIFHFAGRVRDLGLKIKLDTNGTNPAVVEKLLNRGLVDYIAMDVKSSWRNFEKITPEIANQPELCKYHKMIREQGSCTSTNCDSIEICLKGIDLSNPLNPPKPAAPPHNTYTGLIKKTMELIRNSGVEYEFRTTVFPEVNTCDDLEEIKSYILKGERYRIQKFRKGTCFDGSLN